MSKFKAFAKCSSKDKQNGDTPIISYFGKAGAVFEEKTKDDNLHPQIIKMARKSGQLNLSNKGLVTIPQKVFHIHELDEEESKKASQNMMKFDNNDDKWWDQEDLSKLYLNSNSLTSIDPLINKLEALQILDVSDNCLSSLPNTIGDLKYLSNLNLSHNKLTELPEELCKLDDLRTLTVSHNKLIKLPNDIGSLYVLDQLDISYNELETLSPNIGYLQRLAKLKLSFNKLKILPLELCDLFSLVNLDLNKNMLNSLPADMANMPKLEELHLRQNSFTELPKIKWQALKELYIGGNKIISLDVEALEGMTGLRILDLSDNSIEDLPDEITLLQLLERLDLSKNYISSLPAHIGYLPRLKNLSLDGNPLRLIRRDIVQRGTSHLLKYLASKISKPVNTYPGFANYVPDVAPDQDQSVPDQFEMRNTKSVVYQKKIDKIPQALFENARLAKVKSVDLGHNVFSHSFPEKIVDLSDNLCELILKRCKLKELPPYISQLKYLQYLDLQSNELTTLPQELSVLKELREINLSFNKLESLPNVLYDISRLEIIIAGNNKITKIEAEQLLRLKRLALLDLHNNKIDFVPPLLGKMTQLSTLHLEGNTFRVPRFDILSKGCNHILEHLRNRITE